MCNGNDAMDNGLFYMVSEEEFNAHDSILQVKAATDYDCNGIAAVEDVFCYELGGSALVDHMSEKQLNRIFTKKALSITENSVQFFESCEDCNCIELVAGDPADSFNPPKFSPNSTGISWADYLSCTPIPEIPCPGCSADGNDEQEAQQNPTFTYTVTHVDLFDMANQVPTFQDFADTCPEKTEKRKYVKFEIQGGQDCPGDIPATFADGDTVFVEYEWWDRKSGTSLNSIFMNTGNVGYCIGITRTDSLGNPDPEFFMLSDSQTEGTNAEHGHWLLFTSDAMDGLFPHLPDQKVNWLDFHSGKIRGGFVVHPVLGKTKGLFWTEPAAGAKMGHNSKGEQSCCAKFDQ